MHREAAFWYRMHSIKICKRERLKMEAGQVFPDRLIVSCDIAGCWVFADVSSLCHGAVIFMMAHCSGLNLAYGRRSWDTNSATRGLKIKCARCAFMVQLIGSKYQAHGN